MVQSSKCVPDKRAIWQEERERLTKELDELQIELQKLQDTERQQLNVMQLESFMLRDAVRMQQLALVNLQSAVSGYVVCSNEELVLIAATTKLLLICVGQSVQEAIPHEVAICLGKDPEQRREVLLAAKRWKIPSALAYVSERTRFLDPFRPFSETSRFLLDGGDYCALRIDRVPFDASQVSVRQVYDAIAAFFSNMEMRVMDALGVITTRDEIDYGVDGVQQSRYESSLACGIPFETNTVTFQDFTDHSDAHGDGGPLGIVTADFVDLDELYPYRPQVCVRHDITAVLTVRTHTRRQLNSVSNREEVESVVVLTRTCLRKQRPTEISLPPLVLHALRDQLERWGDVMMACVLEQIYGQQ